MLFRSDRKSTRLNSSHLVISYAVFCLKKKTHTSSVGSDWWPPPALHLSSPAPRLDAHLAPAGTARSARSRRGRCPPALIFFFLITRRPPKSTLLPSPTLSQ